MKNIKRVPFNPHIMGGQACTRGMRIPVSLIVNLVANEMTTDKIIGEYPDLEHEDIEEALQYASWLTKEEIFPSIGAKEVKFLADMGIAQSTFTWLKKNGYDSIY